MLWSEIKENLTVCSWARTLGEKLEYSTKSNIECNSGIFKRIFDAINPCIIIYEYINAFLLFSVLFSFIFLVVYGEVMIVIKKCNVKYKKNNFFLLNKLLANPVLSSALHICAWGKI